MAEKFQARLESLGEGGAWTAIEIPFSVEEVFGSRARVSVKGTINGCDFRSSLFPGSGGVHHLMVNKALQKSAGVAPGDTVKVALELDTAPRVVKPPKELEGALAKSSRARAAFEKLSYSHRKAYVDWIEEAKKEETRARRIEKSIEMLAAGKKMK